MTTLSNTERLATIREFLIKCDLTTTLCVTIKKLSQHFGTNDVEQESNFFADTAEYVVFHINSILSDQELEFLTMDEHHEDLSPEKKEWVWQFAQTTAQVMGKYLREHAALRLGIPHELTNPSGCPTIH